MVLMGEELFGTTNRRAILADEIVKFCKPNYERLGFQTSLQISGLPVMVSMSAAEETPRSGRSHCKVLDASMTSRLRSIAGKPNERHHR
jgi:hypothetical protein